MKKQTSIQILLFGLLTAGSLIAAIITSYMLLPHKFSILSNWVSDLGNTSINPAGAKFFNYGLLLTAFFFLQFDIALSDIKTRSKRRKRLLAISQILGVISASAMVGVSLFNGGHPSGTHLMFAGAVMFFSSTFFLGTVYSLKRFEIIKSVVPFYLLFGVYLSAIIAVVFFGQLLGEWIAIGLTLLYLLYFTLTMFFYLRTKHYPRKEPLA